MSLLSNCVYVHSHRFILLFVFVLQATSKGRKWERFLFCLTAQNTHHPWVGSYKHVLRHVGGCSGCGEVSGSLRNKEGVNWETDLDSGSRYQISTLANISVGGCNDIVTISGINLVLNPFPGGFKCRQKKKPSVGQTTANKDIHARVFMEKCGSSAWFSHQTGVDKGGGSDNGR